MAGQNDAGERTEEATPRRRMEARKKGTVARSTDLSGSLVLAALILALPAVAGILGTGYMEGFRNTIARVPSEISPTSVSRQVWSLAEPGMLGLAILAGVALAVGLVVNFAQVGFVLSAESMKPTFDKINPLAGFKRLFSAKAGVEALKTILKSVVFGMIAWVVIRDNWPKILGLAWLSPRDAVAVVASLVYTILIRVSVAWVILAVLDYIFQKKQTDKQLRMTKDELRREMKEAEASPELKAARHQRARKLAKGGLAEKIKQADVVITNPTHFAVAIQYDRSKMHAPMVIAKGQDYLALKIRELAGANKVPIVPNPPLARALYRSCEVGDFVPREQFQAVAETLAYVYNVLKIKRKAA
ncbi:MAG TPA: flagellar biosynthesis protein FlhB [Fimbriimonadaceae bacterium]|nr:flagellar biosynthesis protein FlhB [Fimbriimonadaceae bacterium]HRJ32010.1 flagellar biosynthesis protein FlhB [Fimbriimonadaceae bacterium]